MKERKDYHYETLQKTERLQYLESFKSYVRYLVICDVIAGAWGKKF